VNDRAIATSIMRSAGRFGGRSVVLILMLIGIFSPGAVAATGDQAGRSFGAKSAVVPNMTSYDKAASDKPESMEDQPLQVSARKLPSTPAGASDTAASVSGTADFSRMFIGLLIVIGVIFAFRQMARKMALVPGIGKPGAVRVISRSPLAPRQQILVLHVGKRLIVVGDSGGNMNPLCEISDPDEVAGIIGGSRSVSSEQTQPSFSNIFRRASEPFASETESSLAENVENNQPLDQAANEEVDGLIDKVRVLRQQFRQTGS
jgi:flagellar biogenesis protein FliO